VLDYQRRLEKLEERIDPQPSARDFHIIVCRSGDNVEEVRARYYAEHRVHPAAYVLLIDLSGRGLQGAG
jgi:hypothetical protein